MIRRLLVLLACILMATACTSHEAKPAVSAMTNPNPAAFTNPVYTDDFPDPALLRVGNMFVAYATQGNEHNIQTLTSSDLVHWQPGPDALPELPAWASSGNTWAPEVIEVDGRFVMFYVARDTRSGRQCIGRAESTTPTGPFRDQSPEPFICQAELGGSIDPNPFRSSNGMLYMYWKNDGNCCGLPVHIYGQRLSLDARHPLGQSAVLLGVTHPWQGTLIEAPEMVEHNGAYVLFYSANDYASDHYAVGYAHCAGPLGPCTDASPTPWLASTQDAAGPGHCYPFTLPDGSTWLLFHAWRPDAIGSQSPGRQLWLQPVAWHGDQPVTAPPRTTQQPKPRLP